MYVADSMESFLSEDCSRKPGEEDRQAYGTDALEAIEAYYD